LTLSGGTLELLPHRDGTDGFFMALWEKKGPWNCPAVPHPAHRLKRGSSVAIL